MRFFDPLYLGEDAVNASPDPVRAEPVLEHITYCGNPVKIIESAGDHALIYIFSSKIVKEVSIATLDVNDSAKNLDLVAFELERTNKERSHRLAWQKRNG